MTAPVLGSPADLNSATRARAADLRTRRVPFVMATVVRAERPTSAKAGDVAVVLADGTVEGFVGGECAEASVRHRALEALETGQPVLLRISPGASPGTAPAPDGPPGADGTQGASQGLITLHNPCLSGGTLEIFLEPDLPPAVLVVHGDSPIALALASLAEHLGYLVERTDASTGGQPGDLAGSAAVVVASHGRGEEAVLTAAVRAGVPYVGLVASRTRGGAVLDRLDLPEVAKSRIRTPAGLDFGARKPQEIALSILAEIVSTRPRDTVQPAGGGDTAQAESPAPPAVTAAIDPVCGMTVAVVPGAVGAEDGAELYYFCGLGCRDAFVANPSVYLASR
ncbi:MAG: XdhC family protein [Acidimicrobiales bacterium]|jgi:xanthine dehydrogenase accessory factor